MVIAAPKKQMIRWRSLLRNWETQYFLTVHIFVFSPDCRDCRNIPAIPAVPAIGSKQCWNTRREAHFVCSLRPVLGHAARSSFCSFAQNSGGTRSDNLILLVPSKQWWNTQREAHFVCSLKTVVEHAARSSLCSFAQNSG